MNGDVFGQYINNAYGGASTPGLRATANGNVRLQAIDPFSPVWTAKFGVNGKGTGAGLGNFSCLEPNATFGRGVITAVTGDGLQISDANGKPVNLNIGSCSRVESTLNFPKTGQNIAWRGTSSGSAFNVISATCW